MQNHNPEKLKAMARFFCAIVHNEFLHFSSRQFGEQTVNTA